MNGETVFLPTDFFRPFPAPEDVFANNIDLHSEHLLPLASVNLSHLDPQWDGWIHFILPIEPHDGVVGEGRREHHNYLCRENWIGYWVRDSKCELACDFRFFLKNDLESRKRLGHRQRQTLEQLNEHYEKTRKSFEQRRAHYQANGALHCEGARKRSGRYAEGDRLELVRSLGGTCGAGNWAEANFPLSQYPYVDSEYGESLKVYPKTEEGRDFSFIGEIPTWHYTSNGCQLLLFYDPRDQIVLTTFDW